MSKLPPMTSEKAKEFWNIPVLADKKSELLDYVTEHNTVEQGLIRNAIEKSRSVVELDQIISNMMLSHLGMKV